MQCSRPPTQVHTPIYAKNTNSNKSKTVLYVVQKDSLGVRACMGKAVEDAAAAAEAVGEFSNHYIQLLML
jgi:type IV secretory pathway TrbF-like protein